LLGHSFLLDALQIWVTIFLGGLVALYSSLSAMRGMGRALRDTRRSTLHIPVPPATRDGGVFIAFEGVEGSGKSTQVRTLASLLENAGCDVLVTREPGGPAVAERIRDVLLDPASGDMDARTEALLYAAARAEHVRRVVAPALHDDKVVLCDRFIDSSLAYQGFARELGEHDVLEINRWAVDGLLPDVVVLLDLDADEGLRRVRGRAEERARQARTRADGPRPLRLGDGWRDQASSDRLESEDPEFHRRVAAGYRELARRSADRFVIIDGGADAETIARQVREALVPWLPVLSTASVDDSTAQPEAGSA
jgi:dTMP kinase